MIELTKATGQKIELNTIYLADCVVLMEAMEANSVDLTVTSPPYDELRNYNGYNFNFEGIAKGLFKVAAIAYPAPYLSSAMIMV